MVARVLLLALALAATGCSGPPAAIVGVDGVAPRAAEVPGAERVELFLATSRAPADDPRILFSGERSPELSFARVTVSVPPERAVGEVNRAPTLPPDPRRHFVVLDPVAYDRPARFSDALDAALAARPADERSVLVFVHGFNTDMPSAIVRTAQFVHDSGFPGVPVLFSWPSRGRTLDYVYDINSALHSRDALVETARIVRDTAGRRFDVLAHSMGNLLVVEALRQMAKTGELGRAGRIGSIMLASPDIDLDLFEKQVRPLPVEDVPIYVMVASTDRALALSRRIAGGVPRVGNADPEALAALGITVVDVSAVRDPDRIQHTQFANVPEIVRLIGTHMGATGDTLGATGQPDTLGEGLRDVIVGATLLPARIVGAGRVLVVSE